ncbi:hypothetical protein [Cloacibacterium sp.]|uniref:hypothetical protein n=1 Tax=Cloacibacterium sp. TaxID=1913682 RepID=UPI0039E36E54
MKKILSFLVVLSSAFIFAQTQDLYSLAKGDYLGFNALFDDNSNLYGYVAMYGYGKSGDKTKKFEYVILDKNLNPVANKEFEGDATAQDYFGYIDFRKKLVLYPTPDYYTVKGREFFYPRSKEINLSDNSIKNKIYYDYKDGKFTEETEPKNVRDSKKEDKAEKKLKGYNYVSVVYEIKEGGLLVFEYNDYGSYTNNENLLRFDENKNLLWTFKYNTEGDKKNSESMRIFEKDDKYIYTILTKEVKRDKSFFLQIIDMKTGKVVSQKPITGFSKETLERMTSVYSYYKTVNNDKTFDDKIVMVSKNYSNYFKHTGFVRFILDKNSLDFNFQTLNYSDLKTAIPEIDENGYVESGYYLDIRDFYFLEDGSIGILMEKFKPEGQYNAPKTTDLVYAYTDKDFKLSGAKVFKKDKTKWAINADYLFSQYLNSGKDVVFFYRDLQKDDKTKEKNWNLFINTLINGQFNQEKVQISEKDNFTVIPYVAKEGYILLREYNEKEKFNKIRLERLNY